MEYLVSTHHSCNQTSRHMINLKNDLNRNEWLELVFSGRNKVYGAYELRQHNALTTIKGLIAGTCLILITIAGPFIYTNVFSPTEAENSLPPDEILTITEYSIPARIHKPEPTPPKISKPEAPKVPVQKFVSMKVVPAPEVTVEAPSLSELEGKAIGQETISAPSDATLEQIGSNASDFGMSSAGKVSDEPVGMELLEKYPEFPGGHNAFYKYIGRNLRYPMVAREQEISGRVIVRFIIEKNGSLSDIRIIRGIGGGCDEEAVRVLKNSPPWASGVQNGQKVRVAYTMPIAFLLSE